MQIESIIKLDETNAWWKRVDVWTGGSFQARQRIPSTTAHAPEVDPALLHNIPHERHLRPTISPTCQKKAQIIGLPTHQVNETVKKMGTLKCRMLPRRTRPNEHTPAVPLRTTSRQYLIERVRAHSVPYSLGPRRATITFFVH
jgi:hypothetical protein